MSESGAIVKGATPMYPIKARAFAGNPPSFYETPDMENPFVEVPELAKIMHISPSTAYEYLRAGHIPHARKGKRFVIKRADLKRYVETGKWAESEPAPEAKPTFPGVNVVELDDGAIEVTFTLRIQKIKK